MKLSTTGMLLLWMLFNVGCVTEGTFQSGPESEEMAAQDYLELGIGYLRAEQPAAAVDALERALEYRPRLADAHSAIAIAYDQLVETELAEEHHRRATQLAPNDPIPNNAFAVFLCRQNRWDEAEPFFQRAIDQARAADPRSWMFNAATCARRAGDVPAAETWFRKVLDIDTANAAALRGMLDVSIRTENYWQGRGFYQRLEQSRAATEPDDLLYCYIIETQLGNGDVAGNCARRLGNEFPGSPADLQLRELVTDGR